MNDACLTCEKPVTALTPSGSLIMTDRLSINTRRTYCGTLPLGTVIIQDTCESCPNNVTNDLPQIESISQVIAPAIAEPRYECSECNKRIAQSTYKFSMGYYGVALCVDHQRTRYSDQQNKIRKGDKS